MKMMELLKWNMFVGVEQTLNYFVYMYLYIYISIQLSIDFETR